MKTYLITVMLLICSTASVFADEVNNGEGGSERNIVYSLLNLQKYIDMCLTAKECKLNAEERQLVEQIRDGLLAPAEREKQLSFVSEQAKPGFFIVDGEMKIAKTASSIGSMIYINTDLLYTKDARGKITGLDIPRSVGLLIHELGHHHEEASHLKLMALGVKFQVFLFAHIQQIDLGRYQSHVQAVSIDFATNRSFTNILVNDGDQMMDLTEDIKDVVQCWEGYKLKGFWLSNLHWRRGWGDPSNVDSSVQPDELIWYQPLVAWLNTFCVRDESITIESTWEEVEIILSFSWSEESELLKLRPEETKIFQWNCGNTPRLCPILDPQELIIQPILELEDVIDPGTGDDEEK